MSDDPTPNDPTPGPSDFEDAAEADLDAMLAEATSLAESLSTEVGATDTPATLNRTEATLDHASDVVAEIDTKLDELENLVGEAGHELTGTIADAEEPASESPPPPETAHVADVEPSAVHEEQSDPSQSVAPPEEVSDGDESPQADAPDESDAPIDDLMADLTGPAVEEPATDDGGGEAPAPADVAAEAPTPDFMDDLTQPVEEPAAGISGASGMDGLDEVPPFSEAASDVSLDEKPALTTGVVGSPSLAPKEHAPDDPVEQDAATASLVQRIKGNAFQAVTGLAFAACKRGVGALETINRPFDRLGDPIRHLVGLIALATAGTAAIVYLMSLFT